MFRIAGSFFILLLVFQTTIFAGGYEVDEKDALFAIVTRKGGLFGGFAHNHLIHAGKYEYKIQKGKSLENIEFSFEVQCKDLVVDNPTLQRQWSPRLIKLKVIPTKFSGISVSDRKTVTKTMLSSSQLHSSKYPSIKAKLLKIVPKKHRFGKKTFSHSAKLELTIRDKTVKQDLSARIVEKSGILTVEVVGKYKFTNFGITPYSTAGGTIRNRDQFYLYVFFSAIPKD